MPFVNKRVRVITALTIAIILSYGILEVNFAMEEGRSKLPDAKLSDGFSFYEGIGKFLFPSISVLGIVYLTLLKIGLQKMNLPSPAFPTVPRS